MLIKDLMDKTAAVCVPFDTAQSAATIMKRNEISFIPVVENEPTHMYVGAVTDRLLCLRIVAEGLDSAKIQLAECISYQKVFCRPDDPIEKPIQTMKRRRLNALAVVDRGRNVVGVVLLDQLANRGRSRQSTLSVSLQNQAKRRTSASSADARKR